MLLIETTKNIYSSDCYTTVLKIVENCKPDVVLPGVGMPGEKFMKFLNCIKALNSAKPVIVQSINNNDYIYAQFVKIGADFFVINIMNSRKYLV